MTVLQQQQMLKRKIDIVVLSDTHLGASVCHAEALNKYLGSIEPKTLIINGDFLNMGSSKPKSFPKEHIQVIHSILKMSMTGTKVYYLTGNYDDWLRQFSEFSMGSIHLRDKLVLQLNGKRYWIFHGDLFDASLKISPFLTRLGDRGYRYLLRFNRYVNRWRIWQGKERMSLVSRIKNELSTATNYIQQFEETAVKLAYKENFDVVICGHSHTPRIKKHIIEGKEITYMNSGDWVENLSALEYQFGKWSMYEYHETDYNFISPRLQIKNKTKSTKPRRLTVDNIFDQDLNDQLEAF